ncbi:hypothetical protein EYF80_041824 [Liparis tanakae]|uniref:Uncharacterized protein n=1 Tax=Liparis tanakae TaxID=230148 RepID=A0A4Z2G3W8_9TELE|nr:hypothetical protein EYF80_041824 [Liparis tanakae]
MFPAGSRSDLRNSRTAPKWAPSRSMKTRPCASQNAAVVRLVSSSASLEFGCFLSVLREVLNSWPPTFNCMTGEC